MTWSHVMSAGWGEHWADVSVGTERLLGKSWLCDSDEATAAAAATAASVTPAPDPSAFPVSSTWDEPIWPVSPTGSPEAPARLPPFSESSAATEDSVWSAGLGLVSSFASFANGLGGGTLGLYHERGAGVGAFAGGRCLQGPGSMMVSHGWLDWYLGLPVVGLGLPGVKIRCFQRCLLLKSAINNLTSLSIESKCLVLLTRLHVLDMEHCCWCHSMKLFQCCQQILFLLFLKSCFSFKMLHVAWMSLGSSRGESKSEKRCDIVQDKLFLFLCTYV